MVGVALVVLYNFVYTPLKKITWLNTFVGAVPGALPPVMGWTAVTGQIDMVCVAIFLIFYVWQLPHFFALAWMYKESYLQANLKMLSAFDRTGIKTFFWVLLTILCLIGVTLLPFYLGVLGALYLWGVLFLGVFFLWPSFLFWKDRSFEGARHILKASVVYQPLLFVLICVDLWY